MTILGEQVALCQSGAIVAANAEIRAADDFQIVGQAGMPDGEIVGREIHFLVGDQAVQVRLVRVIDHLLIAVILHHDDENMVQVGIPFGTSPSWANIGSRQQ